MKKNLGIKIFIFFLFILNGFFLFKVYDFSYPKITGDCGGATKAELKKFAKQFGKIGFLENDFDLIKDELGDMKIFYKSEPFSRVYTNEYGSVWASSEFQIIKIPDQKFSFLIVESYLDHFHYSAIRNLSYNSHKDLFVLHDEFSENEIQDIFEKIHKIDSKSFSDYHDDERTKLTLAENQEWKDFLEKFPKAKNLVQVGKGINYNGADYFPLIIQNSKNNFFFIGLGDEEFDIEFSQKFNVVELLNKDGKLIPAKKCKCIFSPEPIER